MLYSSVFGIWHDHVLEAEQLSSYPWRQVATVFAGTEAKYYNIFHKGSYFSLFILNNLKFTLGQNTW